MTDRRRSPEGSKRTKGKEPARSAYDEPPRVPIYKESRMRAGAEEMVYSSSSSSSSYIDISRSYPPRSKFGIRSFFTAPSERRRLRRRKSSRLFKIGNSSSSSVNDDLAYGTGFIKRPKRRGVRSRKGREFGSDRYSDRESNRITLERREEGGGRPPLGRAQTDAEILAIGAGLAKLARDQNRQDLRNARNGGRPELAAGGSSGAFNQEPSRGLVNSRPSHGSDTVDEDGWVSASESEESVDSRLAFGGESNGGWSFFGRKKHRPLSRKNTIVDPRLFGPQNTLHGVVTEPVGFGDVTPWASTNDFGQRSEFYEGPATGPSHSGSQASLQRVYPIPTSDPGRFDARASSVVSGPEPIVVSRPGPIPIQQPQPIAPISQSVYRRSESGTIPKQPRESISSGRGKSLAEAALVGVAGVTVGAVISSSRDDRKRREVEELDERNRLRRRDSEKESKDDRRRDKHSSPDREERREKRREKDDSSRVSVDDRRDKRRERRKDETREERDERRERRREVPRDDKDERREKRREERRGDKTDDRVEVRRTKSETAVPTTVIDPFQYQVSDDAFPTPKVEPQMRVEAVPEVHYVTVEREPDFSRIPPIRDARTPDFMKMHRQEEPKYFESQQRDQEREFRDRALREAEEIYEETTHSTAPIGAAAFGAAVAAVHHADSERETRSDKRRDERRSGEKRSDYDDYDSKPRDKQPEKERDLIQEEADRAYREIVIARKIASQVIRSRSPSPDYSVTDKYTKKEEENPVIRIVTPPGMEDHKKGGPYDAPNADFTLDHVLENPVELRTFRISPTNIVGVDAEGPYLKRDPDADRPRPFLNLVRPTPAPSPMPEKQAARSESGSTKSKDSDEPKRSSASDVQPKDEAVTSPTASTVSKGVTWGENETKHYEVESPSEHRDEFVSQSDILAHEAQEDSKPAGKPKPKSKGWGVIAAGIMGAGVGAAAAASSSETSKTSKSREDEKDDASYDYRGVVVELEGSQGSQSQRNGPPIGPKPSTSESTRVPGAFNDDLDFTATVAAGLQDSGFDPNIVIDDPSFRRRDSPPGSNDYRPYRAPFAETVSDLGSIPPNMAGARSGQGFIFGEVASTPQDWRSVSPPQDDETLTKLSKKQQKKRDKERRRSGDVTPLEDSSATREVAEEPESYFEAPLSKKEQKKRDKLARQNSQTDDITPAVAFEIVEEPESYFETPKKSKKKSKKGSSSVDEYMEDTSRDSRKVSVPVDAFDDLRNDDDEWAETRKSKKKSKRDSDHYDSPSRSVPSSEIASELERSSSKKSKDKSKRKSEQFDPDPTEVSLPPSTPSETSRDGDFDDLRGTRKSSTRDSGIFNNADRGESYSVVSADASRYDDDEPRKSKKKSRSSTKDYYDDSRSVVSAPAGDDYDDSKRSKKKDKDKEKDKKSGGGFFGLFGSKSEVSVINESLKGSKDDFEESKKKKRSKRSSVPDSSSIYGDTGAQSVSDLSRSVSNGNSPKNGSYPDNPEEQNGDDPGERRKTRSRSESSSSKKDSFLGNAGTLGAGVGIAGAAVAIAAQHYQQSKAANANSSETREHEQPRSSRGSTFSEEILDPEITERQFRPSIDPQYGDLLPLPPSNPGSPDVDPIDDLPELPDSRPDTPEPERISREKSMTVVRKNLQETPMKSPSQSAVPLNFLMRNRSQPSSPGLVRSSPLQSPATPNQDSLLFLRSRPRPTSWDSSKEYKPLYLVESNRQESAAQAMEPEEELPALPPSQSTSRSSSQLDFGEMAKDPLSIDTELASSRNAEELLGSEQSTPKAAVMTRDGRDINDSFDRTKSIEEPSLPSHSEQRSFSPEPKSHFGEYVAEAAAAAGLVSTLGFFASSPTHPATKDSLLDELPSVAQQPSPVDPMTKDRSSYLLQSSPMSKKFEEFETADRDMDSPSRKQKSSLSSNDAMECIQEREGIDAFGSPKAMPQDIDRERETTMETLSNSPRDDLAVQEMTRESLDPETKDLRDQQTVESGLDEAKLADEFTFTKSKKDKKKDKKNRKGLSRSSIQDDYSIPEPESSKDVSEPSPVPADPEPPADEFFVTKSKKDKKKDKKKSKSTSAWEPEEDQGLQQSQELDQQEPFRVMSEDISTPANEPANDFFTSKSKRNKKKDKRKSVSAWEPEESQSVSQTVEAIVPETTQAMSEDIYTPTDNEPIDDFSTIKSKEDEKKDKKRNKLTSAWEPEDEALRPSQDPEPELIVETTQEIPDEIQTTGDVEQTNEFSTSKSKKDEKKVKSAYSFDPEEEIASQPLPEPKIEESRGLVEETTTPGEVEALDDVAFAESKKDKEHSKPTLVVWSENDETESSMQETTRDFVDEPPSMLHEPAITESAPLEPGERLIINQTPEDREIIAEPISHDMPSDTARDNNEIPQQDDFVDREENPAITDELTDDKAPLESASGDSQSKTLEDIARKNPANIDFTAFESKKGKKKRGKSSIKWEQENEADLPTKSMPLEPQPESSQDPPEAAAPTDEYFFTESKKSKKDKKKRGKSVTGWEPEEEPTSVPIAQEVDDAEDFKAATFKKGKKKNRKSSSIVPKDDLTSASQQEPIESTVTRDEPTDALKSDETQLPAETSTTEQVKTTESESMLNEPESLSSKPTPMGGPSVWPITPATPSTGGEVPEIASKEHFPTAAARQSPSTREMPEESQSEGYFPSTGAVVAAGATLLGLESLKQESAVPNENSAKDATTSKFFDLSEPSVSPADSKPAPDGLTAGYDNEQLSLAKQLQQEFSSGSKRSKDKKRQSLPPTPAREPSRSRTVEDVPEVQLRARSLSIGPAATRSGESPLSDERKNTYSEDQLELARQLKAEFDSGNKKSKKDKKKRQGLSRSSTQDDVRFEREVEEPQIMTPDASKDVQEPEILESVPKGDGFAAGYQEDQLSLARQLQAEFGKKSKKDKKRRSTSQTPQEQAPRDDYFGAPSRGPVADSIEQEREAPESIAQTEIVRDGLAVGYKEEQLELARQLKEEFGSDSKKSKDKRDKKRGTLLRSNTEDDFSSDAQPRDAAAGNFDAQTEVVEGGPSNEPEDEFAFVTKKPKKDKKGKKRASILQDTRGDDFQSENIPRPADEEANLRGLDALESKTLQDGPSEQAIANPEDDFASFTKKPKKDKKGKKRDSILETPAEDYLPSESRHEGESQSRDIDVHTQPEFTEEFSSEPAAAEPEDKFATFTKKSKKDKKSKKRDILLRSTTEEDVSSDNFGKEVEALHAARNLESKDIDLEPAEAQPEDDWSVPAKPSKKDKKKRQSSIAQENPFDQPDIGSSSTSAKEGFSAADIAPASLASAAIGEASEDFEFLSKKSKKDKKKRGSLLRYSTFDETPEEQAKEVEIQPEIESRELVDDASISVAPLAEDQDDGFEYSSKRSKKNKKYRSLFRSSTFDETPEEQVEEVEVQPEPESRELVDEQEDGLEYLSKKSKGKKKRKSSQQTSIIEDQPKEIEEPPIQDTAITGPEDTQLLNPQIEDQPKEVEEPLTQDTTITGPEDTQPLNLQTENWPKEVEEPLTQDTTITGPEDTQLLNPQIEDQLEEVEEPPTQDTTITSPEDTQPSNLQTEDRSAESTTHGTILNENISLSLSSNLKTEDEGPQTTVHDANLDEDKSLNQPGEEASTSGPPDIFHDFTFTTKKPKKDKKQRNGLAQNYSEEASGFSTPLDPIVESKSIEETSMPVENQETIAIVEPLEQDLDSFTAPAVEQPIEEPTDEWSSFLVKKLKDKKRKSSSRTASQEPSGISTPFEPIVEPGIATEERALPTENVPEHDEAIEEPLTREPENLTSAIVQDRLEEPADEWASFAAKKSKKDKKKSRSSSRTQSKGPSDISTPLNPISESETTIVERSLPSKDMPKEPSANEEPLSREQADLTTTIPKDEIEEPAVEWASFATKKSKKDKKKRKSGLCTPVEPVEEVQTFEPVKQLAEESEQLYLQPAQEERNASTILGEGHLPKSIDEFAKETKTQVQESRSLEPSSQNPEEPEPTDEAFAFVTKRSKNHKKGSKKISRALSETRATTSGLSDVLPIETRAETETLPPSEHLFSSPVTVNDENLTKPNQTFEPDAHEPTGNDEKMDVVVSDLFRMSSKKDKRKRQATVDINMNDGMNVPKPSLTSWADEVEEAEVERQIPIIQDIAKDESLSHIASTTKSAPVDDFFRPTKKGKKGKKRILEATSTVESSTPKTGSAVPQDGPADEQSSIPILAAAGAALVGAALLSKGGETRESTSKSGTSTGAATPQRKLSKKEKKKIIDLGPTPREDIFDSPDLWEGPEPKRLDEVTHADDDTGSDGFGFASRDLDEPMSVLEPGRESPLGYEEHPHAEEIRPVSPNAEAKFTPEEYASAHIEREAPLDHHALAEATQESRDLPREGQQEHYDSDEFHGRSTSRGERITQIPYEKYVPEETVQQKEDIQSTTQPQFSEPPRLVETPPSDKGVSFEEPAPITQEHISTPFRVSIEQPSSERSVTFEDVTDRSPTRPLSASKYGRTSFSDLPVVHEENPAEMETEHLPARPFHDAEANRDSAFVTESPVPRHRGFTDDHDEHVRDSGVHLRDFSPAEKSRAHISSTDDALARLSWPHVDEETETVDLHRSQRPIVETTTKHQHQERVSSKSRDSHSHESHGPQGDKSTDFYRSQKSIQEKPKHRDEGVVSRDLFPSYESTEERSTKHHDEGTNRDHLPSQQGMDEKHTDLHRVSTIYRNSLVKQRVQRIESPDLQRPLKPKEDKYAELASSQRPKAERPKGMSDIESGAALAGVSLGFAAARKLSQEQRPASAQSQRSSSNINRLRTPDPKRPDSVASNRSGTPPLRRSDRKLSGDLRSLSQRSKPDLAKEAELAALVSSAVVAAVNTANPTANEGRVRAKDMADVYDGFGEGRIGSPRSPTRPHSMRRRQSMQVLDLESKVEQLAAENRMLAEAKAQAERTLASTSQASSALVEKDAEIDSLKRTLDWLQNEVTRLTQVNEGLNSAHVELGRQHNERYGELESQHVHATRELQEVRDAHDNLSAGMEGIIKNEVQSAVQDKDREIAQLRAELDAAKEQIREMQRQILASKADEIDFLTIRDEDYFDNACQILCQHVQQWVLRFSKFSDMRACRLSSEINNDKTIDRLDNAILDGSDVDSYLADRIKRRDVFMSMTMNMVWEFIFTRYLFGMDREQRQKLKSLEKTLSEVGPAAAVHHWRATTLTLLSKREVFLQQREQDTQAVVHAIIETLSEILPPPSHLEAQIEQQLTRVMKEAVDLSIEMRTQRAEYMMLPPLLPEYDANGDLASKVSFNAALMNERSGDTVSNEELEEQKAIVRIVLFPLVVKKGDDKGEGDEEIVVCPAQVLVAKPKKSVRVFSPGSVQGHSRISLQSSMPADHGEGSVI